MQQGASSQRPIRRGQLSTPPGVIQLTVLARVSRLPRLYSREAAMSAHISNAPMLRHDWQREELLALV